MAQDGTTAGGSSYTIDNVTFPVGRTKLQSIFDAIRSTNIGNTAPDLVAGQFWIDNNTPSTTVWTLYFYDGTDNISFATIDTINNTVNFIDSTFDLINDTTPQLGGGLDLNSNDITGTGNINITGNLTASGNLTSLGIDDNATSTAITIDSSERIGVGITSPSQKLHVEGSGTTGAIVKSTGSSTASSVGAINNSGTSGKILMYGSTQAAFGSLGSGEMALYSDSAGMSIMNNNASGAIKFSLNSGAEQMRLNSTGLGIGTSSPETKLHVLSASSGASAHSNADDLFIENSGSSGITIGSGATSVGAIYFADSSAQYDGYIEYNHNSRYMRFATAISEAMRIDSSGKVGIGTSNPNRMLTVEGDGGEPDISLVNLDNTNSNFNQIRFLSVGSDDSTRRLGADIKALYTSHSSTNPTTDLVFGTASGTSASTERMRITSDGDVFIGDSNPDYSRRLTVSGNGSADTGLFMYDGSAGTFFEITTNAANGVVDLKADARTGAFPPLTFTTSASERMRIDSSGNLLLDKTTTSNTTAGVRLGVGGVVAPSRTSDAPIVASRLSTDGKIIELRKDATLVGTIGVVAGDNLLLEATATDHAGINLVANAIVPRQNGSGSDNGLDLGSSGNRFKDLYLGGGLYVGGTGSANKLDDYEEGTWTPVYEGTTTDPVVAYSVVRYGTYTKIGNIVYFQGLIAILSLTSVGSGNMRIGGLPFTSSKSAAVIVGGANNDWGNNNHPSHALVISGTTSVALYKLATDPQDEMVAVDASGMLSGSNDNGVYISGFYEV